MRAPSTYRKHLITETAFDTPTPECLYWVGFLMADGCVMESGSLVVTLHEQDRLHLEDLRVFLGSSASLSERTVELPSGRRSTYVTLAVHSKRLCESLATYGIVPRKSLVAEARNGAEASPHFWRGVLDGDGSFAVRHPNRARSTARRRSVSAKSAEYYGRYLMRSISIAGAPPLMAQFADFVLRAIGDRPSVLPVKGKTVMAVKVGGRTAMHLASVLYPTYLPAPALERKRIVAAELIALGDHGLDPPRVLDEAQIAFAKARYVEGWSTHAIGPHLGVSWATVKKALERAGVTLRPPGRRLSNPIPRQRLLPFGTEKT